MISLDFLRTIAEITVAIGMVVLGLSYIWSQSRKGGNKADKDLNTTLNELLEARDKKIADLEDIVKGQGAQIKHLEDQVDTLNSKNGDMEILIKTALKEHFAAHPNIALDLAKNSGLKNV